MWSIGKSVSVPAHIRKYVEESVSGAKTPKESHVTSELLYVRQLIKAVRLYKLPTKSVSAFVSAFVYFQSSCKEKSEAHHDALVSTVKFMSQFAEDQSDANVKEVLRKVNEVHKTYNR